MVLHNQKGSMFILNSAGTTAGTAVQWRLYEFTNRGVLHWCAGPNNNGNSVMDITCGSLHAVALARLSLSRTAAES